MLGNEECADKLEKVLTSTYKLRPTGEVAIGSGEQTVHFLSRFLRITMGDSGHEQFGLEADPRHVQVLLEDLKLDGKNVKVVATPEEKTEDILTEDRLETPALRRQ